MKYLPEWMPGGGFQGVARENRHHFTRLTEEPFQYTRFQIKRKADRPCFVTALLNQGEDESIIKQAAEALYGAGADTVRLFPHILGKC